MGSGRIRLSGFAGTSHYERGSVMDSDFWASRILVAWNSSRVLMGVGSVMSASFLACVWDWRLRVCLFVGVGAGTRGKALPRSLSEERRPDWEVRTPQNRCVGSWVDACTLASVARPAESSVHLSCLK